MSWYLKSFFKAWLLTVAVESFVLVGLLRKFPSKEPVSFKLLIASSIFASSLTLPYVWFVFPYLLVGRFGVGLILGELFAWLAEAIFYYLFLKISIKKALIFSFIANLSSYALGYLITFILH